MSRESWESLLTEKGFMRVPRALRLKRAELGITNNEYTILLDYIDYYTFSGTMNPYRHLSEVSGMSERSIRSALTTLEKKGLLEAEGEQARERQDERCYIQHRSASEETEIHHEEIFPYCRGRKRPLRG